MDSSFVEFLNSQTKKFKQAIMRDYWDYRRTPANKTGFFCLKTTSSEYLLQKFFEKRLEEYIRRYLVNGFLGRVLESRGNGIYPCYLPDGYDSTMPYSNEEYEKVVLYEFVMDSIESNKRVGIRYTKLPVEREREVTEDIDDVYIISWESFYIKNDEGCVSSLLNKNQTLTVGSIRNFMIRNGFSEDEYMEYITTLSCVVMDVHELLGVKSVPKLNPTLLFRYRFEVEESLIEHVTKYKEYQSNEEKIKEIAPEMISDFNWAYQIIDKDNKMRYPQLESQTKGMLMSGAFTTFMDKKYYQALIGKCDYARSFITSEYLYKQYDSNDQFDYTAIISGYLKSIEQLLYHISVLALDKNLKIKSSGKKLENGSRLPYKVDFTSENLENGWCDTTMGALSYLLKESKKNIIENKRFKGYIFDCLQCFIKECRNSSFHKHNIDNWSRVEKIRNNTVTIIVILLGLCKLGDTQIEIDKNLGIERDDDLERAYHWITSIKSPTFTMQFWGEDPVEVKLGRTSEYPSFNRWGFIKDYMFFLDSVNEIDPITGKSLIYFIKRDRVPEKMWCSDEKGNLREWKKMH